MRETRYYGIRLGAIGVEKRKGHVSSVIIGAVDRNPPEGASWTLQFKPTRTITDKALVRILDRDLHIARQRYAGRFEDLELFDEAISANVL
jgi:hypothetical protein